MLKENREGEGVQGMRELILKGVTEGRKRPKKEEKKQKVKDLDKDDFNFDSAVPRPD